MDTNHADKLYLLLQLGRYTEVERTAREVIAEDPASSTGYYYLAQALLCLDRYPEAFEVSGRVLELAPDVWYAHTQRSALLQSVGRVAEAVEVAKTAMRLNSTEPAVHVRLAYALSGADRDAESAGVISEARRLFPNDTDVLYLSGVLALGRADMKVVAEVAKEGLALDPANPGFHMFAGLASGHLAQHKFPEGPERQYRFRVAEQRLAEAVRMDPTNVVYRRLRKDNARDSRDALMVKLLTGWMFGVVLGLIFLPFALRGVGIPCWCFIVLPLAICFLGGGLMGFFPEFSLVVPFGWLFDAVTLPLLPEERRKGLVVWFAFLAATAAALFLPMLMAPVHRAPGTQATRRDNGFRLPSPAKGKTNERSQQDSR